MRTGILEALAPLRTESQRQVILITDGLIGFESEVLEAISRKLPKGSRVHTVGVGSGVNRSLTSPAARAGRGVELVIGLGEDVEPFVKRLLARTNAPLMTEVEISGSAVISHAPARVPDLYGGAPAQLSLQLRPEGGELVVRARTADGEVEERRTVPPVAHGVGSAAVTALFGRERVEDLELNLACGAQKQEVDPLVERTGLDFQISTRLTSWVAVSAHQTVDPRAPRRTEVMPQELAFGLSAEGVGLRPASAPLPGRPSLAAPRRSLVRAEAEAAPMEKRRSATTGSFAPVTLSVDSADDEGMPEAAEEVDALLERADAPPPAARPAPAAPKGAPPSEPTRDTKKEGFFDYAKRLLAPRAPAPSKAAPRPTRRVRATLRRVGKRLLLEIEVVVALTWAPGKQARVDLVDGTQVLLVVDEALTTAPGDYRPGVQITLAMTISDELGDVAMVHLSNGGEVLEIVL